MSSYICGDQTTMAAAEGIARCEGYSADSVQLLSTLLRMANETATGTRATGETVHRPVDQAKRRAYDDLEMIGSCECLAYQLDTAGRCGGICRRLRAAAEKIRRDGAKKGKWRLPNKTEQNRFHGVYLPSTYTTPSRTVTVYDKPAEIPWGID